MKHPVDSEWHPVIPSYLERFLFLLSLLAELHWVRPAALRCFQRGSQSCDS